ncbi:hypothetical protein M433DRAFT_3597 [Acidomyces richmondensis BFW]|nr:MAG: hypothetical protein FE78DRAFT_30432 [Acidomyces sp. 'richmondensis']KYG46575.1 hypothetical protein M433DRAFT_3597 [Acidomyces richmondensis BFW]
MAMPATARRSELNSNNIHSDLKTQHHDRTHPTSTPRPSVSPLSTNSKLNRSPTIPRHMAHTEAHLQEPAIHKAAGVAEAEVDSLDNDDRSSSLSEPEDDQDEVMPEYGTVNGMDELEPAVAHSSLDVDSEAETERLEQTPQKLRKHADSIRKTPSKLSYAATVEDDLSEPPSPLPTGAEAASSTSTIVTGGKKRKRSDTAESSLTSADSDDIGESPRKRNHESPDELDPDQNEDIAETNGTADAQVEHLLESALLEEASRSPVVKTTKGKRGKQKGRKFAKETVADVEPQVEELDQPEEEQPEEGAAKKEEEQQYRAEASSLFEAVAKQFTSFRESLNNERLAITNAELQLLSESDCQHSEYKQQVACVDARRTKQIREANAYYSYRLKCIRERTLGERAQLHSQYFQEVRRLRDKFLYELGEDWYNIQKERRQQHQEEDDKYIFEFPTKRSAQIRQQAQYNQEISVLSGIGMYVGFPAAPDIKGAEGASLEDDLKSMKVVSKRSSQPAAHRQQQPPFYSRRRSVSAHNERLAHDQFIEKNAWAQPQRPIHTHGMPNLTHTPDWAEPTPHSSTRNFIRNLGGHRPRTNSPFMTPLPQKRPQQNERSSSGTVMLASDGVEMPSSVAAAPPTSERMQHVHGGSSTQTSPLVVNKYRQNGTELTGFRNISNVSGISGASTIDAPLDSAEKRREEQPVPSSEIPTPQPGVFGMSQFHLHSNEHRGERSATVGFRAREGAYGTPAPLSTGGARPTSN